MRQLLLFLAFSAAVLACYRAFAYLAGNPHALITTEEKFYVIELLFGACMGGAGGALLGKAMFYAFAGLIAGTLIVALQVLL
jgi:hypothetical protein